MYKKYWQILLSEWRLKGRNGLTIPFIIGSQEYLTVSSNQDVNQLIWDIATSDDFEVYITYCLDVNDLILGVRDEAKKKNAGKFLNLVSGKPSSFFLTKVAYDLGEDITKVAQILTERHQRKIDDGHFSKNNREYGSFSNDDVIFIKKSFSVLNDI